MKSDFTYQNRALHSFLMLIWDQVEKPVIFHSLLKFLGHKIQPFHCHRNLIAVFLALENRDCCECVSLQFVLLWFVVETRVNIFPLAFRFLFVFFLFLPRFLLSFSFRSHFPVIPFSAVRSGSLKSSCSCVFLCLEV